MERMGNMPEMLTFEDMPRALVEYHVEPFREEYIPGSRLLGREWSSGGYDVFFHIPTLVAQKMDPHELEGLKDQVRGWWRDMTNKLDISRSAAVSSG
jgi:hypothetical protein